MHNHATHCSGKVKARMPLPQLPCMPNDRTVCHIRRAKVRGQQAYDVKWVESVKSSGLRVARGMTEVDRAHRCHTFTLRRGLRSQPCQQNTRCTTWHHQFTARGMRSAAEQQVNFRLSAGHGRVAGVLHSQRAAGRADASAGAGACF